VSNCSESDFYLIEKIVARDQRAFRQLVDRYAERIFRYSLRLTNNREIAEEVANDVALELWRSAGRFAQRSKVSTWLLGIARNKSLNALRKNQHWIDGEEVADIQDEEYGSSDQFLETERAELKEVLGQRLREMSMEHRDVLELTFYQDCSYREIAHIVGCPEATVRTRMFYAKRVLRQVLVERGSTHLDKRIETTN